MDVPALIASPVGTVSTMSRAAPVAPVPARSAGLAARPSSQRGERSTLTAHLGLAVAAACSWSVHKRGRAAVKGPKRVQMRPGCSAKKTNKFILEFMTKSIVSHFSSISNSNLIKTCRICRNLLDLWGSDMFCVLDLGISAAPPRASRYTSMCKDSDPEDSMRRRFEAVVAEAQEKICKAIEDSAVVPVVPVIKAL